MSLEPEEFSLRRARLLSLIVLIVVTTAIALANLSSEPVTAELLENAKTTAPPGSGPERAYGWPLMWYWRSAERVPGKTVPFPRVKWPVTRYSKSCLIANLWAWLSVLASSWVGCELLQRCYRTRLHLRPQLSTLVVLTIVSVPTVLANLSFDVSKEIGQPFATPFGMMHESMTKASFGWPLIWYRHAVAVCKGLRWAHGWDYSAALLAGNLVIWLAMLVVLGLTWEWLLRRYRPRLRFGLRTMLAGVGLAAALCAWGAAARNRANEQDALIAWAGENHVYVDRWGPKWLELVGADRFRRRVVGASITSAENGQDEECFKRLRRLPHLRYLEMNLNGLTPGIAAALGDLRQLRMLRIYGNEDTEEEAHECLAPVGKLTQLEQLFLRMSSHTSSNDRAYLDGLTNLHSLTLELYLDENEAHEWLAEVGNLTWLERLCLNGYWEMRGRELAVLGRLTNLKSLTLGLPGYDDDEEYEYLAEHCKLNQLERLCLEGFGSDLAELAPLESLVELGIDVSYPEMAGLESLIALKGLRSVHVGGALDWPDKLASNSGHQLTVPSHVDGLRCALAALRKSNPGIVIDGEYREFQEKGDLNPPWELDETVRRGEDHSLLRACIEERW